MAQPNWLLQRTSSQALEFNEDDNLAIAVDRSASDSFVENPRTGRRRAQDRSRDDTGIISLCTYCWLTVWEDLE